MAEKFTELHLVNDLRQALSLATDLGAVGIGLDVEGVLIPYIGNDVPIHEMPQPDPNTRLAHRYIREHTDQRFGLLTNNTNSPFLGHGFGPVDFVAQSLSDVFRDGDVARHVPYVHRGMVMPDGAVMGRKPSGEQGIAIAKLLKLNPADVVLIDDQGVKNAGEAVRAGFKAIIAPDPIGRTSGDGRIIEHPGVRRFRTVEPAIYRSLKRRGSLARFAYKAVAGVSIDQIADFVDHKM